MRGNLPACKVLRTLTCTQHTQRARENAMPTMLELFTQYQQALFAAQESAGNSEDLVEKEKMALQLYNSEKRKLRKAEKMRKTLEQDELVEQGEREKSRGKIIADYKLLQKNYTPHSKWPNFQEARTAIWVASGGQPANWTPKSGRTGSNHIQSHHVGKDHLAYKITAKDRTGPAILHVADDNPGSGPVDALVGPLELTTSSIVLSETATLLQESEAMKSFLVKFLEKTPKQVIEASDEERSDFLKKLTKGNKDPTLAEMKAALADAGDAGLEPGHARPSRKGTAKHLLSLLMPDSEDEGEEEEGEETEE